ncbi:hypothetical protein HFN49_04090 [Rhizobium leguminosarum]|nr:hypothetical protein [Rhizobium ruizarguesonis]MBY5885378.1 hypothetical protein [Rhizobium leguminosarum]QSZ00875.1 hypothetical protein J3P73_24190 [Rhizobium ruizarguesonis]
MAIANSIPLAANIVDATLPLAPRPERKQRTEEIRAAHFIITSPFETDSL